MKNKALTNIREEIKFFYWNCKSLSRSKDVTNAYKLYKLNNQLRNIQGYISAFEDMELLTKDEETQFQYVVRTLYQETKKIIEKTI